MPPHSPKEAKKIELEQGLKLKNWCDRKIPYPPNFNKTAAKTIDPATGASTCALGSHKCIENIGSFTKNAIKIRNVKRFKDHNDKLKFKWSILENNMFIDFN